MVRQLLKDLHQHFSDKENPTENERYLPSHQYYCPIECPESQEYMECKNSSCEAITDEKELEVFGSSSLWVPLDLIINDKL